MAGIGTGTDPRIATNRYPTIGGTPPATTPPTGIGGWTPTVPGGQAVKPPPTYGGPPVAMPPVVSPSAKGPGVVPAPAPRRQVYGRPGVGGIGGTAQSGMAVRVPGGGNVELEGVTAAQKGAIPIDTRVAADKKYGSPSVRMAADKKGGTIGSGARLNDMTMSSAGNAAGGVAPIDMPYGTNGRWTQTGPDAGNSGEAISGGVGSGDWVDFRNRAMSFLDGHQVTDPEGWGYMNEIWSANHGRAGETLTPEQAAAKLATLSPKYRAKMDAFFQKHGINPSTLR